MRRIEAFRYSRNLLRSKSTFVTMVFLILASFWGIQGMQKSWNLHKEMSVPIEVFATAEEIPEETLEEIKNLDGVRGISKYMESVQTLTWKEYQTELVLCGMEEEYLQTSLNGTMPYLILDASVLENLKNEKKESPEGIRTEEFLLETVKVNEMDARVVGIIPETKENQVYAYASLEDFGKLTDIHSEDMYYLVFENGYYLKQTLDFFQKTGMVLCDADGKQYEEVRWKERQEEIIKYLTEVLLSLICGLYLIYIQGKLWKMEHKELLTYIRQMDRKGNSLKRIYRYRILWYLLIGMFGGILPHVMVI